MINSKEYMYIKSHKVCDVGFWQEIKFQNILGNVECVGDTRIKLKNGVYMVMLGIQVVTKCLQDASFGVFCGNECIPEFVVMGTVMAGGVSNLAGNAIFILDKESELSIKNMSKCKVDCYNMMLSICRI